MVSVEPTHYLTHLVGTIVCSPHGQCGAAHYLTHLVGTVVRRPRGHKAGSILVEHAHQLPQPAALHHTSSKVRISLKYSTVQHLVICSEICLLLLLK